MKSRVARSRESYGHSPLKEEEKEVTSRDFRHWWGFLVSATNLIFTLFWPQF